MSPCKQTAEYPFYSIVYYKLWQEGMELQNIMAPPSYLSIFLSISFNNFKNGVFLSKVVQCINS